MRVILFTIISLFTLTAQSQAVYDSLTNVPQTKISCLYGQTAKVVELNELYPEKNWSNKLTEASNIGKDFTIIKAERDQSRPHVWITLASTSDTIYYRLTSTNMKHAPFLVSGYFEKQKQLFQDRCISLKLNSEFIEVNSGKEKEFATGDKFTCSALSLINTEGELVPTYILKNTEGDVIHVPLTGFEKKAGNTINNRFTVLK